MRGTLNCIWCGEPNKVCCDESLYNDGSSEDPNCVNCCPAHTNNTVESLKLRNTSKEDLVAVLKVIEILPQSYYSRGPEFVLGEIEKTIKEALNGKWAGLGKNSC